MALPLAVFSATWKGLPLIYNGQEIPNFKRLLFFDRDPLQWEGGATLQDFYRKLLGLRKSNAALQCFSDQSKCYHIANSVDHHVFSYVRTQDEEQVIILINFSVWDLPEVEINTWDLEGEYTELFSEENETINGHTQNFSLPAWGYKVLIKKKADQF